MLSQSMKRWAIAAAALVLPFTGTAHAFPDQPIVIIVPTQAGGAVDAMARLFARAIEEEKLLPVPVVIKNMPGSGGILGTREIRNAKPDGYTIGLWTISLSASKVLGVTDYGIDAFTTVAQTGREAIVVATQKDGKFKSIQEVIEFSKKNPGQVLESTNIGTLNFFATLMLSQKAGVRFRPVQSGGGSERLKAVLGGHADIAVYGTSVYKQHAGTGLRGLVLLSAQRDPTMPEVPTAAELGYHVVFDNPDLWLAPKGVPEDRLAILRQALRKASESKIVQQGVQDGEIVFRFGPELDTELVATEKELAETAEVAIKALKEMKKQ
jgi:tripartite-type tricarboxylate transporter receptor subunit TctC